MAGPDSGCDSLSFTSDEYPCDVCKIIRHEIANLLKSSVVFLSFTT